jgi:hypothetical protein
MRTQNGIRYMTLGATLALGGTALLRATPGVLFT